MRNKAKKYYIYRESMPTTIYIVEEIADNSNEKEYSLSLKILVVLKGSGEERRIFDCMWTKTGGSNAPASMGGWVTYDIEIYRDRYPQFREKIEKFMKEYF
jgi:hypothetical protein